MSVVVFIYFSVCTNFVNTGLMLGKKDHDYYYYANTRCTN